MTFLCFCFFLLPCGWLAGLQWVSPPPWGKLEPPVGCAWLTLQGQAVVRQRLLRAGLVELRAWGLKTQLPLPLSGSQRELFSDTSWENLVKLLEAKWPKCGAYPTTGPPEFLTLKIVYTEPPAIRQLDSSFPDPLVPVEASSPVSCDSISLFISLTWGQKLALRSNSWYLSFFPVVWMVTSERPPYQTGHRSFK